MFACNPGRRFALPWARLLKPFGLRSKAYLRAIRGRARAITADSTFPLFPERFFNAEIAEAAKLLPLAWRRRAWFAQASKLPPRA